MEEILKSYKWEISCGFVREINVNSEAEIFTLWPCVKSLSWDHGLWFQDLQSCLEEATLRQAGSCNKPLAGQILWQVLKYLEISLKRDSCEREQGVHFFLLLWPFWNILSSLNGMVSVDKKMVSVRYLLRTDWNIWRVTSASLWNVWNVNLVSKKNLLEMSWSESKKRSKEEKLKEEKITEK